MLTQMKHTTLFNVNVESNLGIQWYECEDGKCPRIMEPSWMQGRGLIYLFMRDDGDL